MYSVEDFSIDMFGLHSFFRVAKVDLRAERAGSPATIDLISQRFRVGLVRLLDFCGILTSVQN